MAYMSYTTVSNPKWNNAEHSSIDCDVIFDDYAVLGAVKFTADPLDVEPHGVEIFNRCVAEDFGPVSEYEPPTLAPSDFPLSADNFYTMLDDAGKLDAFVDAIETVTPTSKKLTCRNQFNNSTDFTWDMVLIQMVSPLVWPDDWESELGPIWIAAAQI